MSSIESTQADLIWAKDRMLALIAATPEERLGWKPSPSARSILEIVAHSALALKNILSQLQGTPFATPTSAEANRDFLSHDARFQTRPEVEEYLEKNCVNYIEFLGTLNPDELDKMVQLPFGLGHAPVGYFMTMGYLHTMGHIAQIEYVQTIYGDQDWHTGF